MRKVLIQWIGRSILSIFPCVLMALGIGAVVYFFANVIGGFDFIGFRPVTRWTYLILQVIVLIYISIEVIRSSILPAWRCKKKYGVDWSLAFEFADKSEAFIRFALDQPEGYWPWNRESFDRYARDESYCAEIKRHPDFRLHGRFLSSLTEPDGEVSQGVLVELQMNENMDEYRPGRYPVLLVINGKRTLYHSLDELLYAVSSVEEGTISFEYLLTIRQMVEKIRCDRTNPFQH